MRIDKYLKNSRIIKRRAVAKEACDQGRIMVNEKKAKPGTDVSVNDIISIVFGRKKLVIKVERTLDHATKDDALTMYEVIEEVAIETAE